MKSQTVKGVTPLKETSVREGGKGANLSLLEKLAAKGSGAARNALKKFKRIW